VEPLTAPSFAVMVVEPTAAPLARPALEIVAIAGLALTHDTCVVSPWVLPSEYRPVAVSCNVVPFATEPPLGAT
jgi:hypothetical protein